MTISNESSKSCDCSLSNKWMRVFWLGLAGLTGFALFKYAGDMILDILGIASVDTVESDTAKVSAVKSDGNANIYPANTRGYLVLPILSFFVFIALWFFRTYDTRQQIEQTNRQLRQASLQATQQLQQANFAKGLDNLVSDDPLKVDIGVILLLEVSKVTTTFDKEIRLAFIKRLKELPGNLDGRSVMEMRANRLSYAQYIIQWLIDHPKVGGASLDLRGMDCRYQEFTSRRFSGGANKKLEISKIFTFSPSAIDDSILNPGITFEDANCENVSFKGVSLGGFDFTNAINVDITGGFIEHFPPRGLGGGDLSDDLFSPTDEIIKNPDWPEPGFLTHEVVKVRQDNTTYPPNL